MFDPNADIFFESPNIRREPPGKYGVLHLLRRDIFLCLGWDPITQIKTSKKLCGLDVWQFLQALIF